MLRAPHKYIFDWVMKPYDGYFPETTRRWETVKSVLLCYIAIPILVFVVVMALVQG